MSRIQAFDFYRNDEGRLCFALYDPKENQITIQPIGWGPLLNRPSITEEAIAFLEGVWGDRPPDILETDIAARNAEMEQHLASKGVSLKYPSPYSACTGLLGVLEWQLSQFGRKQKIQSTAGRA